MGSLMRDHGWDFVNLVRSPMYIHTHTGQLYIYNLSGVCWLLAMLIPDVMNIFAK